MKFFKTLLLVAVICGFAASASLAGPFSDVPNTHWAYNAISDLTRRGVIEGYPDAKFNGNKAMTRYEAALMVARALDRGYDSSTLERLTIEFADELALLGVKVSALEDELRIVRGQLDVVRSDVNMLKHGGLGNIRLSGEMRIRHAELKFDGQQGVNNTVGRFRLNYDMAIDENVTAHITADADAHVWGQNLGIDQGINLFGAFIEVKDFGGVADMRVGRQPLVIGKGVILDNQVDGILFHRMYRGTSFGIAGLDIENHLVNNVVQNMGANIANATLDTNDGLQSKLFTISKLFRNSYTVGAYVMGIDLDANIGNLDNLLLYGVHLDGRIMRDVLGFLEFATWDRDDIAGVTDDWDYAVYKLGFEWTINRKYDLTVLYGHRDNRAPIISVHNDYTDSIYWASNAGIINNGNADSYLNSNYIGAILGAKLSPKTSLDLWFENLEGDKELVAGAAADGVFDQTALQLVASHQYRDNTSFKLRYRNVQYDDADADFVAAAAAPLDYEQYRIDMTIRF